MAEYRISRGRLKFGAIGTVCQVCSMQAGEIQAAFLVMHCRRRGLAVVVMTSGLGSKIQSVLENSGQPVLYVLFVADGVAEIVGQFVFQLCSLAESVRSSFGKAFVSTRLTSSVLHGQLITHRRVVPFAAS